MSGLISISLFLFFMALFFVGIMMSNDVKSYALQKDDQISISVNMANIQVDNVKKSIEKPVEKEVEKPVVKEVPKEEAIVQTQKKEINIDNLFSQVTTKDIKKDDKKVEKEVDKRVAQELSKKSTKAQENQVESLASKMEKINSQVKSDKATKASTGSDVNEYRATIQALIYENFFPPENSQQKVALAVIELDAFGKMIDFRILTYSNDSLFDSECDKIKNRLKTVLFPKNPDNKSGTYKIQLISE
ncbi:MAG: TonB C-terminal domain-containing protein [Sulfurimonas sp.]